RGDVRIGVRAGHLEHDDPVVRDGIERVDDVELATRVLRVVHAAGAQAEFEPQVLIVPERFGNAAQVFAGDEDGHVAAVDDDLLHRLVEVHAHLGEHLGKDVYDVVEIAAVRT